jgi:hypothetical protein
VTDSDSLSEQGKSVAEQWQELLGWLDDWFRAEKVSEHDFDVGEKKLFSELSPGWLAAAPGGEKIAVLEAASDRFGRERVFALIGRLCATETTAWWKHLATTEGDSPDTFIRLLWDPLPEMGFEFTKEQIGERLCFRCTRCPQVELAEKLNARDWLYAMVCATDPHAAAAFGIPFERTKTLMQGDGYCNHTYFDRSPGSTSSTESIRPSER